MPSFSHISKNISKISPAITVVICLLLSFFLSSTTPMLFATGFFIVLEVFGVSATRLATSPDTTVKVGDFRSLDRGMLILMAGWVLFVMLVGTAQFLWNRQLLPSFAFSDYRSKPLSDDQFRLYAWGCESTNGKPFLVTTSGDHSYIECGRTMFGKRRLAGRTGDINRAMDSYIEAPNKAVRLPSH